MPNTTGLEERVCDELEEVDGSVEQDELINELISSEDMEEMEVLQTLRSLMEQDEVSYSVDWQIRLKD